MGSMLTAIWGFIASVFKGQGFGHYRHLVEAQDTIAKLREENAGLKRILAVKQSLTFRHNAYWLTEKDDEQSGPFCSNCLDTTDKAVRMTRKSAFYAFCNGCEKGVRYADPPSEPESPSGAPRSNWVNRWRDGR